MAQVFALILGVLKAIPVLDKWFEQLVAFYVEQRIASMKKENREAIKRAFDTQDQRPIEEGIGNPNAGELSGVDGTEIRDDLPGVKP